jgi:hypothetical protein
MKGKGKKGKNPEPEKGKGPTRITTSTVGTQTDGPA